MSGLDEYNQATWPPCPRCGQIQVHRRDCPGSRARSSSVLDRAVAQRPDLDGHPAITRPDDWADDWAAWQATQEQVITELRGAAAYWYGVHRDRRDQMTGAEDRLASAVEVLLAHGAKVPKAARS